MAQILRPVSTFELEGYTGDHNSINQLERDDSTFAAAQPGVAATLAVLLEAPQGVPGPGTCEIHWVHARVNRFGDLQTGGNHFVYTCTLYSGPDPIASSSETPDSWQPTIFTVLSSDIPDWSQVGLRFTQTNSGGAQANRRGGAVSWAQLVAPDFRPPASRRRRIIQLP
jgi:hypothetical protein